MSGVSATKLSSSESIKAYVDAQTHISEGTAVLSTGETGATKFLREDGDNSCSWQTAGSPSITDGGNAMAITIDSSERVGIGTATPGNDLHIYTDDTSVSSMLRIAQDGTGDAVLEFEIVGNRSWAVGIDNSDSDKFKISSSAVDIATDPAIIIDTTGHITPGADNTQDLGSSSKRWRNIYTTDLHLSNERGDWTVIEEEDYLTLRNNKTGKVYKLVMEEIE
jgi:hypothetical protein